ncbi:hypothetical protein [Peijinzhouia sedimentorum]
MNFKINDTDLSTFGISFLEEGAMNELLKFPKRKEQYSYSWKDEHGTERDTDLQKFESREVSFSCVMQGADLADFKTKYEAFRAFIIAGDYFEFEAVELAMFWKLLYSEIDNFIFDESCTTAIFDLKMIDDTPQGYTPPVE